MNEELQKELAANLSTITEYVKQGAGFVQEQAPLLVQEMITYGVVWGSVSICIGLTLLLCAWFCSIYAYKADEDNNEGMCIVFFAVTLISGIVGLGVVITNIPDLIKAIVAPRLYILDQLRYSL